MSRFILAFVALAANMTGCASPARYIETSAESGVVAIPTNTDEWPNFHQSSARSLIEKHVGPAYEIVEQREVVTGQSESNSMQTGPVNLSTTTTRDVTEWRIAYRKRTEGPIIGDVNFKGVTTGLTPAGGIQQTEYLQGSSGPAEGIVPSVGPGATFSTPHWCTDGKCKQH